jgi:hypothetical protein
MTSRTTTTACPRCGSRSIPIVYGLPGMELFEAADRGEVALGGCVIEDGAPEWRCRGVDCGLEFGATSWD